MVPIGKRRPYANVGKQNHHINHEIMQWIKL